MDIYQTRIFKLWQKYEHHLGLGALALGFTFDLLLAKRPDSVADNALLLSYLFVAGALIIVLNLRDLRRKDSAAESFFLLLVLQFCFGGLSSNLLVLYGKSGTFTADVIFLGLLVALIFGNEYLRSRYSILRLNVGVYYFLILTYCTIAAPTFIFHAVGPWVFVGSGLLSLLVIGGFLSALYLAVFRRMRRGDALALPGRSGMFEVCVIVGAIYLSFSGLYFLNAIPPVPLGLKDIGIYHSVLKRSDGNYIGLYEPAAWWQFWRDTAERYTLTDTQSAFCFSSVFAPTDLETPIYHSWQYKDPATGQWEERSKVSFAISGGRGEGYRGFTVKSALEAGEWRCDVETGQGQLIGQTDFTVVESSTTPALSEQTL